MNDESLLAAFRRQFEANRERVALIDAKSGLELTYGQVEDLSSRLAKLIVDRASGGKAGVAFVLENSLELALCYFACLQCGRLALPINSDFHPDEVSKLIAGAEPGFVISDASVAKRLLEGSAPLLFGDGEGDEVSISRLRDLPRLSEEAFPSLSSDKDAFVFFTSGSTGNPKAVPFSFHRFAGSAAVVSKAHRHSDSSRLYCVVPMAYVGGAHFTFILLSAGGSVVIDKPLAGAGFYRYWSTVLSRGANSLFLTPSIVSALVSIGPEDDEQRDRIRETIRWAISGMAPLSPDLKRRFEEIYDLKLDTFYGITETLLTISSQCRDDIPEGSIGRAIPDYEILLAFEDGTTSPRGEDGELRIGGPWIFEGYWNQEEQTRAAFDEHGLFRTGDLARIDSEGNIFVTGRSKDLIIRGGLNIFPVEVERALLRIEGVKEAAVYGVPDELYGERVVAVVSPSAGVSLEPRDVLAACREHIAEKKLPNDVHVVPQLPHGASGKVDKKALKERFGA